MDKDLIKTVAQEVLNGAIFNNYQMYLLIIGLSLISAVASSFLTSYFKKRGESFATKADLDKIVSQLKVTTKASEQIKAEISKELQEQLGHKVLLREKLEAIISETFELEAWLETARNGALKSNIPNFSESPLLKIEMYQAIYFPEALKELRMLHDTYYPILDFIIDLAKSSSGSDVSNSDDFFALNCSFMRDVKRLRDVLIEKYSSKAGL
ncbi:hypothetical protein [Vibrio alginolyticus]|uniref:hypothetical protein n=1 Tax=Vibrio alginolyticus TaxID=663 RepID=UPI000472A44C